ncbi:MAG TPA: endopeptidase La, partial [Candidatus Copromorpha excrementigallinarum]|nr:endopeptidase La [Candidatus Copromorpha excrementigallinarum]
EEPGRMADMIASHLEIRLEDKQVLLETLDPKERLEKLNGILIKEIEILNIEQDISSKVKSQINKNQREYYLREQMRAIQEELGVTEDVEDEVAGFMEQLEELSLEEKTRDKIEKEIKRFSKMQPASAEATVSRNYIETVLALPWNKSSEENIDLNRAEEILNEDHYGLDKVKERVLEYLAVIQLSRSLKGPILCLVGPPGVGKTSIAKSIARSVGREFVRMSLGGVRDEAEIRGHRRTYIGAIPGRIISSIKDSGTNNPVFLFDEVDKIGADYKGDPASALLEVLDPEQNKDFTDHYLEVPFDLSKVMFITTANTTDTIPRPLLDRMEVIEVSGYTEEEKLNIAMKYLVPKQIKENGLTKGSISFTKQGIKSIINYYTRESGVRNLEREIGNICRKVAKNIVCGETDKVSVSAKKVTEFLGKKRFRFDIIKGEKEVGVTTGLAWTIVGGDTLFIETTAVPGTGKLVLTGQLGDVMQESAKAGVSYIRSVASKLKIDPDFYKKYDLHIHIPEGATPKDGPSAGVTMCTAIISTLTGIPARKDVAMTGEITLRGKVLPVGGIREKVMAAHRAGIRKVLLPKDNEADINDIPEGVRNEMEFVLIKNVNDALKQVLVKDEEK